MRSKIYRNYIGKQTKGACRRERGRKKADKLRLSRHQRPVMSSFVSLTVMFSTETLRNRLTNEEASDDVQSRSNSSW